MNADERIWVTLQYLDQSDPAIARFQFRIVYASDLDATININVAHTPGVGLPALSEHARERLLAVSQRINMFIEDGEVWYAVEEESPQQKIMQYLRGHIGGRPSNIETLVIRGMVMPLYGMLPDAHKGFPEEDAVMSYLQQMSEQNDGIYAMPDGGRLQIVRTTRPDWRQGEVGFYVVARTT